MFAKVKGVGLKSYKGMSVCGGVLVIPLLENKTVSWFLVVRLLVSKFLGFLVLKLLGFLFSKFRRFNDLILLNFHSMFSGIY